MALTGKQSRALERQVLLTVAIDDDEVNIAVAPNRTVGDVIERALSHLEIPAQASACQLASYGRLYMPDEPIAVVALDHDDEGTLLTLRLPL